MKDYSFRYSPNYWIKLFSIPIAALIGISISVFTSFEMLTHFDVPPIPEVNETWYTVLVLGIGLLIVVVPSFILIFQVVPQITDRKGSARICSDKVVINLGRKAYEFELNKIEIVEMGTPGGALGCLTWIFLGIIRLNFYRMVIENRPGDGLKIVAPMKGIKSLLAFYEALSAEVNGRNHT